MLLGFQAAGAAPLVLGHPVESPETVASAIRIGNPARWEEAMDAVTSSRGRIAAVEARALSWVLTKTQLEAEAKAAKNKAGGQAGGAVITTGAGGNEIAQQSTTLPWWAILIAVGLIAAPFVIRTIINAQRAKALADAAKGS